MISELFFSRWKSGSAKPNQSIQDLPDYQEILEQVQAQQSEVGHNISSLSEKLSFSNESSISSFFKAKNAAMINYSILLNVYMLQKISNGSLQDNEQLIEKLLENKILISKMNNTQKKLQYQVDKIMQLSDTQQQVKEVSENGGLSSDEDSNPLKYKPRPGMLSSQLENGEGGVSKAGKYVPPKLASALQDEDIQQQKRKKRDERRKDYLKSKLMATLLDDDNDQDAPRVIDNDQYNEIYYGRKQDRGERLREQAEEEQLQRIQETKKDKKRKKYLERVQIDEERVDHLGDLNDMKSLLRMEGLAEDEPYEESSKKKPKKFKKAGGTRKFYKLKKLSNR